MCNNESAEKLTSAEQMKVVAYNEQGIEVACSYPDTEEQMMIVFEEFIEQYAKAEIKAAHCTDSFLSAKIKSDSYHFLPRKEAIESKETVFLIGDKNDQSTITSKEKIEAHGRKVVIVSMADVDNIPVAVPRLVPVTLEDNIEYVKKRLGTLRIAEALKQKHSTIDYTEDISQTQAMLENLIALKLLSLTV